MLKNDEEGDEERGGHKAQKVSLSILPEGGESGGCVCSPGLVE